MIWSLKSIVVITTILDDLMYVIYRQIVGLPYGQTGAGPERIVSFTNLDLRIVEICICPIFDTTVVGCYSML